VPWGRCRIVVADMADQEFSDRATPTDVTDEHEVTSPFRRGMTRASKLRMIICSARAVPQRSEGGGTYAADAAHRSRPEQSDAFVDLRHRPRRRPSKP